MSVLTYRKCYLTIGAVIDDALKALAEPRRREILTLIRHDALPVGEIARHFDVSRPAISQHLAVLEGADLVTVTRDGTRRLYRARPEGTSEVRAYLDSFWTDHLARLKDAVESDHPRTRRSR